MKNVNIQLGKYTLAFVMPWTKILLKSLPLLDFYFILGLEYLMAEGSQFWQPLHFHKWNISKPPNLTVDEESSMTLSVITHSMIQWSVHSMNTLKSRRTSSFDQLPWQSNTLAWLHQLDSSKTETNKCHMVNKMLKYINYMPAQTCPIMVAYITGNLIILRNS